MSGFNSGCRPPTVLTQADLDSTDGACKKVRSDYQVKNRAQRRAIVFGHYGSRCACCGESEVKFLTIDHIEGQVPELEEVGYKLGGDNLYKYLVSHNYPPGYRCLCCNCNMAIGWWGECPHKTLNKSKYASPIKEALDILAIAPLPYDSEGVI